uniref:HNH endonuclease n=1 Tax=Shewanella sp. TaxID=50422 RepID=UPI0040475BDE
MLKKICSQPCCKLVATKDGRCELHQLKQLPSNTVRSQDRSSTTVNNHIYQSTKWRKLRARKFKEQPLCEHCYKLNIITPTDVIDHIVAIIDDDTLAYTYSNLQALCHSCHNIKTAKETKARKYPRELSASDLFNKIKGQ